MVRTIIHRYSSPVRCKILSRQLAHVNLLPSSHKTIPVIIKDWVLNARAAEMRGDWDTKGSWLRLDITNYCHKTSVTQQYLELTITQSAEKGHESTDWDSSLPVLPLWRFPTNCGPKARYEHHISQTRLDGWLEIYRPTPSRDPGVSAIWLLVISQLIIVNC